MKIRLTDKTKDFTLLQCTRAPSGCESYVGREGLVYRASEKLHGPGVVWIWNMRMISGAAEVPIREGDEFEFSAPGNTP